MTDFFFFFSHVIDNNLTQQSLPNQAGNEHKNENERLDDHIL